MKQKDYMKPTMKVVKLQHRSRILAGSGEKNAKGENFSWDDEE